MVSIRRYCDADANAVGQLIADTYSSFNLTFVPQAERARFLGPFAYAYSPDTARQEAIAQVIQADIVLVADDSGAIVGVLRGRSDKLQSLFIRGDRQRQGIGRRLVEAFEEESRTLGATTIRVQATLYATPFYLAMGYRRTTGIRLMTSFDGAGLPYQPMKKTIRR